MAQIALSSSDTSNLGLEPAAGSPAAKGSVFMARLIRKSFDLGQGFGADPEDSVVGTMPSAA